MNTMILNVGDWSKDGHNQNEKVLIQANKTLEEIRQGYKDSCLKMGIQFNHNEDYTGILSKLGTFSKERLQRQVCTEYEDNSVSEIAYDIMVENGMDISMLSYEEEDKTYYVGGVLAFTKLWFEFVKLSIPDLEYSIIDNIPSINGFWNKDLNCQFGYGLFE